MKALGLLSAVILVVACNSDISEEDACQLAKTSTVERVKRDGARNVKNLSCSEFLSDSSEGTGSIKVTYEAQGYNIFRKRLGRFVEGNRRWRLKRYDQGWRVEGAIGL